jgi:restriction system protein
MELLFDFRSTLILIATILALISLFLSNRNTKHKRNIRKANRCIKKLKSMNNNRSVFGYLRKVDPFVFEEIILSALKENGHKIKRNRRYTGDEGIDGRVTIKGDKFLIQAKRYSGHINLQHVREFILICEKQGRKGLFVHTGKTGKASWATSLSSRKLDIVSGDRLVGLLLQKQFMVRI